MNADVLPCAIQSPAYTAINAAAGIDVSSGRTKDLRDRHIQGIVPSGKVMALWAAVALHRQHSLRDCCNYPKVVPDFRVLRFDAPRKR